MNLTPAQATTVRNWLVANASALSSQLSQPGGGATVAAALNQQAPGPFVVWRTDIRASQVVAAITGSEFVALTAIKQNGLMLLITPGIIDASSANIRADFSAIFAAGTSLTALTALSKRNATYIERILATGTGTTASPGTMTFQGSLDYLLPVATSQWTANLTSVVKDQASGNIVATVEFTNSATSQTFTRQINGNDLTQERLAERSRAIIGAQGDAPDAAFPTLTLGSIAL